MLLGVIADTHEAIERIEQAKKIFAEKNVEKVIHLGDYCAGPSVRAFEGVNLVGILGNNDGDYGRIAHNFEKIGGDFRREFAVLEEDGLKIACYHGTEPEITEALIHCNLYDVVLTGHTHEVHQETVGKTLALNPGSAHGFGDRATIALLDTSNKEVEIIDL